MKLILLLVLFFQVFSWADRPVKKHIPALEPTTDSIVGRYPAPIYPRFEWPERVTPASLKESVVAYARRVGTCSSINLSRLNPGQQEWLDSRTEVCSGSEQIARRLRESDAPLEKRRDEFCTYIREHFVKRGFKGGACSQYGNCGDAAHVNYCLAHASGLTEIKFCQSSWQHLFTVIRKPETNEICVLDRWHLRGTKTDEDLYFCSQKIAVVNGTLNVPKAKNSEEILASKEPWYQFLGCYDPLESRPSGVPKPSPIKGPRRAEPPRQITLTASQWDVPWEKRKMEDEPEIAKWQAEVRQNEGKIVPRLIDKLILDEKQFERDRQEELEQK